MSKARFLAVAFLSSALVLGGCSSKPEVKTGSLTQRYTISDGEGRLFGIVEFGPLGGGAVYDVQGRVVGVISAPATNLAAIQ